ncbi:hypothetical protein [Limosilactobacillus oris]|uniref:hypothetical protein n=1 Tax=Limosilactobacillus oris TaxID=1632 RepID=UPI00320AA2F7
MDKDKEFEAYHRGYDQGRFDEYADRTGRKQAKAVRDRLNRQKNCPYCHAPGTTFVNLADLQICLKKYAIVCDNKRGCYKVQFPIFYCPMCGRPLGGNEDE